MKMIAANRDLFFKEVVDNLRDRRSLVSSSLSALIVVLPCY